jgi:hypothetical protein
VDHDDSMGMARREARGTVKGAKSDASDMVGFLDFFKLFLGEMGRFRVVGPWENGYVVDGVVGAWLGVGVYLGAMT